MKLLNTEHIFLHNNRITTSSQLLVNVVWCFSERQKEWGIPEITACGTHWYIDYNKILVF